MNLIVYSKQQREYLAKQTKVFFLCILLTCFTFTSYTQILTIEKFRFHDDTSNVFVGHLDFGLSFKRQLQDIFEGALDANIAYLSKKHTYITLSEFEFQRVSSASVLSNGFAHVRANFQRKKRVSPELFSQIQYNLGLELQQRILAGGDIRYHLLETKKTYLIANSGLFYEFEEWEPSDLEVPTIIRNNFIKATFNITITQQIDKNVFLFSTIYYQARPDFFFQPRFITDSSLKFKFSKRASIKFSYSSTYDALPFAEIARFYYTFRTGFSIDLN